MKVREQYSWKMDRPVVELSDYVASLLNGSDYGQVKLEDLERTVTNIENFICGLVEILPVDVKLKLARRLDLEIVVEPSDFFEVVE